MVGRVTDENVFQLRLNGLFSGSDRGLTNVAVAQGLLARGYRISTAYLSQLRHGARSSPSDEVVSALADYFDVPLGYFFTIPWSGDRARVHDEDAEIVDHLADQELRQLLRAANGLSATSLDLLSNLAAALRISESSRTTPTRTQGPTPGRPKPAPRPRRNNPTDVI
ncbi:helix-turn-helix domain-containing protein [Rhodococcus qingshengii]|uniref:helix-turn-helix domain-containing protein n=1 Tax=Rhodococcus qingshengii TaxID=334542 RepID=UPI003657B83D